MARHMTRKLNETQMEVVCGGTPNAGQNLLANLQSLNGGFSIKINISKIFIIHTIINAPVIINVGQGL